MNDIKNQYEQFARRRRNLLSLVNNLGGVLAELDQVTRLHAVSAIAKHIERDDFKVIVLGAFKTGKSTFINALLGEQVLPAYATPCTAVINEIKWNEKKKAVLHFANPLPSPLAEGLPNEVIVHIQNHSGNDVPPMEVDPERLEEFVVIRDPAAKHGEGTPYSKVELFWPLELCKHGVEIIDSPGLNEHAAREKVTMDYLSQIDAVMFMLNCSQLASMSEMQFFDTYVHGVGHDSAFFICNRIDAVRPRTEQDRVKMHGMQKLKPLTTLSERGVHFISALDALEARLDTNEDSKKTLIDSGIISVEKELASFLVNDRGRIKLIRPVQELRRICEHLVSTIIPTQISMLSADLKVIQQKFDDLQPRLKEAQSTRERIIHQIELSQKRMEGDVADVTEKVMREIVNLVPGWAVQSEVQTTVKVFTLKHREIIESLITEVSKCIEDKIQEHLKSWKKNTLAPLVEKHSSEMNQEITADIESFYINVDRMQATLTSASSKMAEADTEELSGTERFYASLTGFFVGDLYSGLHGARFGFSGLGIAIGTQIALTVTLIVLGIANPFVIIPVLLGGGLVSAFINADGMTSKIKRKVGDQFAATLSAETSSFINAVRGQLMKSAKEFRDKADQTLTQEIQQISEQVNSILIAKKNGEEVAEAKRIKLKNAEDVIRETSSSLFDLAAEIACGKPSK